MGLQIHAWVFNDFAENTYLIWDEDSSLGILIDPGCATPEEQQEVYNWLNRFHIQLQAIILTHAHLDHIVGVAPLTRTLNVPLWMHRDDLILLEQAETQGQMWGIPVEKPPAPSRFLNDGDTFTLNHFTCQILHVPGHSPGHIALYFPGVNWLIAGDLLFAGSIGRTDLPGGNYSTLMQSIERLLRECPPQTTVYPGHGPPTTLQAERQSNPFILEWFQAKQHPSTP